MTIVAYVYLK